MHDEQGEYGNADTGNKIKCHPDAEAGQIRYNADKPGENNSADARYGKHDADTRGIHDRRIVDHAAGRRDGGGRRAGGTGVPASRLSSILFECWTVCLLQ